MLSILVPVYNAEKNLKGCLDSILAQTYTDYEIVLVNDGSADGSGAICEAYAAQYPAIRVIHQENGGVSRARNVLLAAARGAYITFVDADDALDPWYLETLLRDLRETESDIAICSWDEVSEDGVRMELNYDRKEEGFVLWTGEQAVNRLLYQKGIDTNLWGKLYTRQVLEGVVFPEGKAYEDIAVVYQIFLKARRVCYRPQALYLYTINTSGISQSKFTPRRMDLIDNVDAVYEDIRNRFPQHLPAARSRLLRAYIHVNLQIPNREEFKGYKIRTQAGIRSHCRAVAGDREAKRGTRMAAGIACIHPVLLRWLRSLKAYAK